MGDDPVNCEHLDLQEPIITRHLGCSRQKSTESTQQMRNHETKGCQLREGEDPFYPLGVEAAASNKTKYYVFIANRNW